ncbi:MAG: hypothetical protein AABZ67_06960, partial [Pseudomonadota bacterium]
SNLVASVSSVSALLTVREPLRVVPESLNLSNGAFRFEITGLPAQGRVVLQVSPDLVNWRPILANPTWRIQPVVEVFSRRKRLSCNGGVSPKCAKGAVVKTCPIPKRARMCIIQSRYVFALHDAKEKRQGTSLLQSGGKPPPRRRPGGPTARALPGRDQ